MAAPARTGHPFRESLKIDASAYRLVHGEGDLLPSLVADRYGDYVVLQTLSQATDRLMPEWTRILNELIAPKGILARNDGRVRGLEGLETKVEVVSGEVPAHVEVHEGRVRYDVDLFTGQKTGLFLDQRENREAASRYAHGRLLDCFSYHGGFALALAPHCTETIAIESSEEASAHIRDNAKRNGIDRLEVRTANVFDELREMDRGDERFDTIVLDPPAFAKSRAALPKALAGYKEINLRALRLLNPGGILVTLYVLASRRRGHVRRDRLRRRARRAGADLRRRKAHAGPRSPRAARRAGDVLLEVFHPAEAVGFREASGQGSQAIVIHAMPTIIAAAEQADSSQRAAPGPRRSARAATKPIAVENTLIAATVPAP